MHLYGLSQFSINMSNINSGQQNLLHFNLRIYTVNLKAGKLETQLDNIAHTFSMILTAVYYFVSMSMVYFYFSPHIKTDSYKNVLVVDHLTCGVVSHLLTNSKANSNKNSCCIYMYVYRMKSILYVEYFAGYIHPIIIYLHYGIFVICIAAIMLLYVHYV